MDWTGPGNARSRRGRAIREDRRGPAIQESGFLQSVRAASDTIVGADSV